MNPASDHVFDVDETNFEARVLEESMRRPVLVDFWATWCGPCRSLGPLLDELADTYAGAFAVAKVDVDSNPMIAQQFGAQSIPVVFALYQGRPVDRFVGALPRAELKRFIDSVLERCGVSIPAVPETVPEDPIEAEAHWRAVLGDRPKGEQSAWSGSAEEAEALLALGRLVLFRGQRSEAESLLGRIKADAPEYIKAESLLAVAGLMDAVVAGGGESALRDRLALTPEDQEAAYLVACADAARGLFAAALSVLVTQVSTSAGDQRARAQSAARVILSAAGRDDEAIEAERRRLSRLLF